MSRPWSPVENEALRQAIYAGMSYDDLLRLLPGRSRSSIQTRVHEIRACGMHGGLVVNVEWEIA